TVCQKPLVGWSPPGTRLTLNSNWPLPPVPSSPGSCSTTTDCGGLTASAREAPPKSASPQTAAEASRSAVRFRINLGVLILIIVFSLVSVCIAALVAPRLRMATKDTGPARFIPAGFMLAAQAGDGARARPAKARGPRRPALPCGVGTLRLAPGRRGPRPGDLRTRARAATAAAPGRRPRISAAGVAQHVLHAEAARAPSPARNAASRRPRAGRGPWLGAPGRGVR